MEVEVDLFMNPDAPVLVPNSQPGRFFLLLNLLGDGVGRRRVQHGWSGCVNLTVGLCAIDAWVVVGQFSFIELKLPSKPEPASF